MNEQSPTPCKACEEALCATHKADVEECNVCRELIPKNAERCNKCGRYQRGLRHYMDASLALLGFVSAIASSLAAAFAWAGSYLDRDSYTVVAFLSATDSVITVSATNTGKRPSVIRGAWLQFPDFPIDEAELELFRDEKGTDTNAVPATGSSTIRWVVRGLPRTVSYEELERNLNARPRDMVRMRIEVQESDDSRGRPSVQEELIPLHRLEEFIRARAPQQGGPV